MNTPIAVIYCAGALKRSKSEYPKQAPLISPQTGGIYRMPFVIQIIMYDDINAVLPWNFFTDFMISSLLNADKCEKSSQTSAPNVYRQLLFLHPMIRLTTEINADLMTKWNVTVANSVTLVKVSYKMRLRHQYFVNIEIYRFTMQYIQ